MRCLSAVALLVPALAVAAPVPKAVLKEPYYPVTVGAKRVSEDDRGGCVVKITEEIVRVEGVGGTRVVTTSRLEVARPQVVMLQGRVLRVQKLAAVSEWVFEVAGDRVCRLPADRNPEEDPEPLLDLAVKPGVTWTAKTFGGLTAVSYTRGQGEEVVETPAGRFQAVRVDSECELSGRTQKTTRWYARGVGVVKEVLVLRGAEQTCVLKSFTPGDGEKKAEPKKDK